MSEVNGKNTGLSSSANNKILTFAGFGLLLLAVCSVMTYLWGDLLISEFQADICDTLLWAENAYKSGRLLSPAYYYPYVIPFGGQLLMLPFIPVFGASLTTIRLGMTLFFALYTAVLVTFFYVVVFRSAAPSFLSAGCIILLLESNKKLREVMYAHVIHYSLAVIFVLLMLTFLTLFLSAEKDGSTGRKRKRLYLAFLAATVFFCSADGLVTVALALVPFAGGYILERLIYAVFEKNADKGRTDKRELAPVLAAAFPAAAGYTVYYILKSGMHANYSKKYYTLVAPTKWFSNFKNFVRYWVKYFMRPALYGDALPLTFKLSASGKVFNAVQIIFMCVIIILLVVLTFVCWKRLDRIGKITVMSAWTESAVTALLFTVTPISDTNWRMIPMFILILVALAVLIKAALNGKPLVRTSVLAVSALTVLIAANAGAGVLCAKTNTDVWYGEGTFLTVLKEHDLHYGFSTYGTFCQLASVLSDGDVQMYQIGYDDYEGVYWPLLYQNKLSDFTPPEGCERFFILQPAGRKTGGASEVISLQTFIPSYVSEDDRALDIEILIFDHYPLEDAARDRYSKYVKNR